MGNVVLLMDAVKQVCHRALGKDRHVFSTVGLMAQGNSGLGLVVVVSCRSEISFECLSEPQSCERGNLFLTLRVAWRPFLQEREARVQQPGGDISPNATGFKPRLPHPGDHALSPLQRIYRIKHMWYLHKAGIKLGSPDPWHLPG
jgi:hypothetical protein